MAFVGSGTVRVGDGRCAPACARHPRGGVVMAASRREVLSLAALAALSPLAAAADEVVTKAQAAAATKVTGNYSDDAKNVLENMQQVTNFKKGTPGMADVVIEVRQEMNDFVARYRRNDKVNGSSSFNTLYTAINTLSGHYSSYGNNYPVPEKRRKRLTQQFGEIDRALKRGR